MRYTFRNQPEIGQWNLAQLANSLLIADLVEQARFFLIVLFSLLWHSSLHLGGIYSFLSG